MLSPPDIEKPSAWIISGFVCLFFIKYSVSLFKLSSDKYSRDKQTEITHPEEKMENKFFNPLESVSVNMNLNDTPGEEVELLDFELPSNIIRDDKNELIIKIKNYINSLNNNRIKINESDIDNKHQIIITIE